MRTPLVTITGGSGVVGQMLRAGLGAHGYRVCVFDQFRGPLVDLLRQRHFGASRSRVGLVAAHYTRRLQRRVEATLVKAGVLRPSLDNILDLQSRLAARFRGSYAVVHLAAIAHPHLPGALDADFQRINYDGSVNVFEAARSAGVEKFIFASSAQVYGINRPACIDQFPILESNYCPTLAEGQSMYGYLKLKFERYLAGASGPGTMQAIALRLEYPGARSETPSNFYISTSVENLVAGFRCALTAPSSFGFEAFNLADREVDERIVDVQGFLQRHWPTVPNYSRGNESLLGIDRVRKLLGYEPARGGTYYHPSVMW